MFTKCSHHKFSVNLPFLHEFTKHLFLEATKDLLEMFHCVSPQVCKLKQKPKPKPKP